MGRDSRDSSGRGEFIFAIGRQYHPTKECIERGRPNVRNAPLVAIRFTVSSIGPSVSHWRRGTLCRRCRMPIFFIDTRDKPGLLIAAMRAFEGGQVSFEGDISQTNLGLLPGVSTAETPELRRSI